MNDLKAGLADTAFDDVATGDAPMVDINVTPLVDVMLVLVIIFLVTIPVITQQIGLDLPVPGTSRSVETIKPIRIVIANDGSVSINDTLRPRDRWATTLEKLAANATRRPPRIHIEVGDEAAYGVVAGVLAASKQAGIDHVSFIEQAGIGKAEPGNRAHSALHQDDQHN